VGACALALRSVDGPISHQGQLDYLEYIL